LLKLLSQGGVLTNNAPKQKCGSGFMKTRVFVGYKYIYA
jgi:hypothetical protein